MHVSHATYLHYIYLYIAGTLFDKESSCLPEDRAFERSQLVVVALSKQLICPER